MATTTGRLRQPLGTHEQWTITDANEVYEVERWGKDYFSISTDGHVLVHPTADPARSIDLKQLVDDLQARGIMLPLLIRFRDILQHRLKDIHDAFAAGHRAAPVHRPLLLRLPDQGEPAAPGRRGGARLRPAVPLRPRGRLEAGAARRHGDGVATTRRSSATASRTPSSSRWRCWPRRSGATIIPVVEKYTELGLILRVRREGRRPAAHRHARQAGRPRRRALAVVGRLSLEVRPDGRRDPAGARRAEGPRHAGLLQAAALPPRQPDPQHPHRQGRAERGGPHLRRAARARAPASSTWTSAAASASTTTARRRTSSRA